MTAAPQRDQNPQTTIDDKAQRIHLPPDVIGSLLLLLTGVVVIALYGIFYLLLGHATARVFLFRFTRAALWQPVALGLSATTAWVVLWQIWLRGQTTGEVADAPLDADGDDARRRTSHDRRWRLAAWTVCSGTVIGTLLWCVWLLRASSVEMHSSGDGALIELYTLYSSQGLWGLGPYSRFGWNHPGPLFFYSLVPFYLASLQNALALNAAAFAINIVSLTTALWATLRHGGTALASLLAAALGWYLWRTDVLLPSTWNPHVVLLPVVVLLVTSGVVASGRLSLLPIATATASFIAQTHVGLLPLAAVVTLIALVAGVFHAVRGLRTPRTRRSPRTRSPGNSPPAGSPSNPLVQSPWIWLPLSIALGVLLWLPPLLEQVASNGGNLGKIVRFFAAPNQSDALPVRTAVATWATTWSAAMRPDLSLPYGNRLELRTDAATATSVGAAVLLLCVFGSWAARRGRLVEAWCCRLSAVSSILAVIVIGRIRGGLADHLVPWVTVIGLIGVVSLAAVACIWLGERVPALRRGRAIASAAVLVLLIGSVREGANQLESARRHVSKHGVHMTGDVEEQSLVGKLHQDLQRFMSETEVRKPLISPDGETWAETAGIVVQLFKRETPVAVPTKILWMFGSPLAPRGDEDAEITIADAPASALLSRRQGDCMLTARGGISVHLFLPTLKRPSTASPTIPTTASTTTSTTTPTTTPTCK